MDRELILATLLTGVSGPLIVAAGAIRGSRHAMTSARALEQAAWRRLWLPILPAALVLAFLIGWALQEPEASEPAGPVLLGVAGLFTALWLRALVRAGRSLRLRHAAAAMTTGLWRPQIVIAPTLAARLDERALRAAIEHEAAHARHRDPLRLWLAQLATDLQWPMRAARVRLADWRHALELARDAEACERVDGADLAAAVLEAAQLETCAAAVALAPTGAAAFSDRIHRLLDHAADPAPPARRTPLLLLGLALGLALAAGAACGELIVGGLPGLQ